MFCGAVHLKNINNEKNVMKFKKNFFLMLTNKKIMLTYIEE